jgi:hypothetical protein
MNMASDRSRRAPSRAQKVFVLQVLGIHILNSSAAIWRSVTGGLDQAFIDQGSPRFLVATLVWIAVTIRVGEWKGLMERRSNGRLGMVRRHAVTLP